MCTDHPIVQDLVGRIEDRRILTYGENPQADVRLMDVEQGGGRTRFRVLIRDRRPGMRIELEDLVLPMPGLHNALNATAAIAVAHELGVGAEAIRKALAGFGGVKRRFTRTGAWNGVEIFDDYGHHPVEIAAVLKAARAATEGQVIAVVQPHRYTRLSSLFNEFCTCFNDADAVIVAPVYAAGEQPIPGADRDSLVRGLKARGHRNAIALERSEDLAGLVARPRPARRLRRLPRRRQHHAMGLRACRRARRHGEGGVAPVSSDLAADLRASMPDLRGRLLASASLAEVTWFRVGGPAEVLFSPADEDDLAYFLSRLPAAVPVSVDRARLEPDRARRRRAGRRHPARRQGLRHDRGRGRRPGPGRRRDAGREGRARRRRRLDRRPRLLSRHPGRDRRRACA